MSQKSKNKIDGIVCGLVMEYFTEAEKRREENFESSLKEIKRDSDYRQNKKWAINYIENDAKLTKIRIFTETSAKFITCTLFEEILENERRTIDDNHRIPRNW